MRPGITKAWLRTTPAGLAWSVPQRALVNYLNCRTGLPTAAELLSFCEHDARGVRDGFEVLIVVDEPLLSLGSWLMGIGWHEEHAACNGNGCADCCGYGTVPRPPIDWEEAI